MASNKTSSPSSSKEVELSDLAQVTVTGRRDTEESIDSKRQILVEEEGNEQQFRLYKRRWMGLVGISLLNITSAFNWVLFTSIANITAEHFNISLTKVNWLSNIVCALYVVVCWFVPSAIDRFSLRSAVYFGAIVMAAGAWIRYGAAHTSSPSSSYGLLFIGSVFIGIAQPIFQVIPPQFSENWMAYNFRTTSTMIMAVSSPFGNAISDIIAPALAANEGDLPNLLLWAGVITSIGALSALLVFSKPPTPPSLSSHTDRADNIPALKAIFGIGYSSGTPHIPVRARIDFWIIVASFTVFLAFFDSFGTLINQIFEPQGYSENAAGFFGAAMIIAGLIAAAVSAPLIDRVFIHRQAFVAKCVIPVTGLCYLGLVWAIKPNDYAGIYALVVIVGSCGFILLPIALELAAEVLYPVVSPNTTSSLLYLAGNGFSVVTIVVMNALRAGEDADPPKNMKKALIFEAVVCMATVFPIFFLRGEQKRRIADEERVRKGST